MCVCLLLFWISGIWQLIVSNMSLFTLVYYKMLFAKHKGIWIMILGFSLVSDFFLYLYVQVWMCVCDICSETVLHVQWSKLQILWYCCDLVTFSLPLCNPSSLAPNHLSLSLNLLLSALCCLSPSSLVPPRSSISGFLFLHLFTPWYHPSNPLDLLLLLPLPPLIHPLFTNVHLYSFT